jgi:malate dehydrogenase
MTRLDHNRALSQLAEKTGAHVTNDIKRMIIWGNHSATQYPDLITPRSRASRRCRWSTRPGSRHFIPTVQQRGAAIIKARGASSAASAAPRDRPRARLGARHAAGDWVSMGMPSDGSYGIPEGVIYGYPVTCKGGKYEIVQGLAIDEFSRARMDATHKELLEERDGVKDLLRARHGMSRPRPRPALPASSASVNPLHPGRPMVRPRRRGRHVVPRRHRFLQ